MGEDLKVLPVKKLPEKGSLQTKRKLDPRLPGATEDGLYRPALVVIQAPVRSGKSNLVTSMLYQDNLMRGVFDEIYYISPTVMNDDTTWAIRKDNDVIKIAEHLEEIDLILQSLVEIQKSKSDEERDHTLIVLDDMLGLIKTAGQSYFSTLCSKYRHWKISMWVCVQNFRSLPPTCRFNASHYIIFKTNNRKELGKMEEEFEGNFPFLELYEYATDERFQFLYLDLQEVNAYKNFDELIYQKFKGKKGEKVNGGGKQD
jgi:hypothetical protein